jgi:hypothetical protein
MTQTDSTATSSRNTQSKRSIRSRVVHHREESMNHDGSCRPFRAAVSVERWSLRVVSS